MYYYQFKRLSPNVVFSFSLVFSFPCSRHQTFACSWHSCHRILNHFIKSKSCQKGSFKESMVDCIHALNRRIPQKQTQLPETKIFPENRQNPKRKGNRIPTIPCFRAENVRFRECIHAAACTLGTFGAITRQRPSWTSPSQNVWAPSGELVGRWMVDGDRLELVVGGLFFQWNHQLLYKSPLEEFFNINIKTLNFIVIISSIQSYRFKFK